MKFDREIIARVAKQISPRFDKFAGDYDLAKYPAGDLATFRAAFASRAVPRGMIGEALEWKWGHSNKCNYPQAHRNLIAQVERFRDGWIRTPIGRDARQTFTFWTDALGKNSRFVTRAFLTHLAHRSSIAIIDQHNWRAMRHLLAQCGFGVRIKSTPREFSDVEGLSSFIAAIGTRLGRDPDSVDRFLMMFGKSLKIPRRSRVTNAGG